MIKKIHTTDRTETALITAIQSGNEAAYKQVYLQYYDRLCRYVFSLANNQEQAEDIVQETLLGVWEKRAQLNIKTSLSAYLYQVTRNKYIDLLRKKSHQNDYLAQLHLEAIMVIENEEAHIRAERLAALHKAINELPPKRKEIFVLSKMQNLKYREIAEQLNISERTVESQIRKAFIFLREKLLVTVPYLEILIWYHLK